MAEKLDEALSPQHWLTLMGKDLPEADSEILQPTRVENGKVKIFSGMVNTHFVEGTRIGAVLRDGHVELAEDPKGSPVSATGWWDDFTCIDLELPPNVRDALPDDDVMLCLLVKRNEGLQLMPIQVEEHGPDILGPRVIDEFVQGASGQAAGVTRHVVKGFNLGEFSEKHLGELEDLVSAEPLRQDPITRLAQGSDWIAWQTRSKILGAPDPDDELLRQKLEDNVFGDQQDDGSWDGHVVKTAYGILHALSLGLPADDRRLQQAASWLLKQPAPDGRPGMWIMDRARLQRWDEKRNGRHEIDWEEFMVTHYTEDDHDLFRTTPSQQEIPTCTRNHHAGCDTMMHPSATAAMALCACGHTGHTRLKTYANTMYQHSDMFGYFCSCWGIYDAEVTATARSDRYPDFNRRANEHPVALAALPYGHGRDPEDVCALAKLPRYPHIHRPDLSDTNGWVPYFSRDIGREDLVALDGAYWQNADCWAKPNRALALFPGWSGSVAEFFALFQCHLYQTPFGEWNQGYVSGIFRMIEAVTRQAREAKSVEATRIVCFAKLMLLRTVPWLRHHQKDDGLWHLAELPRQESPGRPPEPRLGTYHIVSVLSEFGLLDRLRPL